MHLYRWVLGTLSILAFWLPTQVHAAPCSIANPVLPCEISNLTFDTFAGNYSQNRSFYRATSYNTTISGGYLAITIKDGFPHGDGYAYTPYYFGATVWTSPEPYNAEFKAFGPFSGSNIKVADDFTWTGAGKLPRHNYGLFIGVRDPNSDPHPEFRSDVMASRLAGAFAARPESSAFTLTGDLRRPLGSPTDSISLSEIHDKLSTIRSLMKPDDTFTLYISGHGGSVGLIGGAGDELVHVGDSVSDNWLATELKQFNGIRKMTFIDACHSGGFWGSGDLTEVADAKDLAQLDNIAFFAASGESKNTYYRSDGLPFFGLALEEAFLAPASMSASSLNTFLQSRTRALTDLPAYTDTVFYEAGFGTPTPVDPLLLAPLLVASADFDLSASVLAVPEPSEHFLFLLGLVAVFAKTRLRKNDS